MVKPDASVDYYAALELSPNCTEDDIKKQYRKLALQFHPDRNPGREAEASTRFQSIGTAHEVLLDPDSRRKYDLDRRRGKVNNPDFPRPAPPRRNPFPSGAAANYPPPPRRGDPRHQPPPQDGYPSTAGSGAQRYRNFPGPPPTGPKPSMKQDSNARTNMYNAFAQMNNPQKTYPQRGQNYVHVPPPPFQGPRYKQSGTSPPGDPDFARHRASVDGSVPRSAWEEVKGPRVPPSNRTANFKVPPWKPGMDAAAARDGAKAPSSNSYSSAARFSRDHPPRMHTDFPPNPPPRSAPTAKRPDAANAHFRTKSGDDVPFAEGDRDRMPYMSSAREKTVFDSDWLRKASATHDSSRFQEDQSGRGAAFPRRDSRDSMESGVRGGFGKQEHHAGGSFRSFVVNNSGDDEESDDDSVSEKMHRPEARRSSTESGYSSSSLEEGMAPRENDPSLRPKARPSSQWTARRERPSGLGKSKSLEEQNARKAHEATARASHPFTFPEQHDSFHRSSNPDIRAPTFHAGGDPRPSSSNSSPQNPSQRRRASSLNRRPSPLNTQANSSSTSFQSNQAQNPENGHDPLSRQNSSAFSAERWSKDFAQDNWAAKWAQSAPQAASNSPTRKSNERRPRVPHLQNPNFDSASSKAQTVPVSPTSQMHQGTDNSINGESSTNTLDSNMEGDAMDIDPPHNSDAQQSSTLAEDGSTVSGSAGTSHKQPPQWHNDTANAQRRGSHPENGSNMGKKSSGNLAMNDLQNVPPLNTQTTGGVNNMSDLKTNLPFKSQTSPNHPANSTSSPGSSRADLPKPPKPPLPPHKLTQASWTYYLQGMTKYIGSWNDFNLIMVTYFKNRCLQCEEMEKGPAGGMVEGWLGAVGETETLGGWSSYVKGLKDDESARLHWNMACERHFEVVQRHDRLRNQILDGQLALS